MSLRHNLRENLLCKFFERVPATHSRKVRPPVHISRHFGGNFVFPTQRDRGFRRGAMRERRHGGERSEESYAYICERPHYIWISSYQSKEEEEEEEGEREQAWECPTLEFGACGLACVCGRVRPESPLSDPSVAELCDNTNILWTGQRRTQPLNFIVICRFNPSSFAERLRLLIFFFFLSVRRSGRPCVYLCFSPSQQMSSLRFLPGAVFEEVYPGNSGRRSLPV